MFIATRNKSKTHFWEEETDTETEVENNFYLKGRGGITIFLS